MIYQGREVRSPIAWGGGLFDIYIIRAGDHYLDERSGAYLEKWWEGFVRLFLFRAEVLFIMCERMVVGGNLMR